jgi:hypothetical protein
MPRQREHPRQARFTAVGGDHDARAQFRERPGGAPHDQAGD